jgi:hypothetical protein
VERPITDRGTFVSLAYILANIAFWASGTTLKIFAAVATGYAVGVLTSVGKASCGAYLLFSFVLAFVWVPLIYAALAVWCFSLVAALVIFIRRILGRVPLSLESSFWSTVDWMALVLILGVSMFNYTTRFGTNPGEVESLDLGVPAHLFSLVVLLVLARIGRSGVR